VGQLSAPGQDGSTTMTTTFRAGVKRALDGLKCQRSSWLGSARAGRRARSAAPRGQSRGAPGRLPGDCVPL